MSSQSVSREMTSVDPVTKSGPLVRQSSIYSLTLDEFQNTLCEQGKNFGSMNMDEFLTNIWTAEENQAIAAAMEATQGTNGEAADKGSITRQCSLHRQGSLTLPAPWCRKTVDEIWADMHREEQQQLGNSSGGGNSQRQTTFGEMTLEDFLIKAGVVRDTPSVSQAYGLLGNGNALEPDYSGSERSGFGHVLGMGYADRNTADRDMAGIPIFPLSHQHQQQMLPGEASGYGTNGNRVVYNGGLAGICFNGRMGNDNIPMGGLVNGGFRPQQMAIRCGSPVSPGSSDGMCPGQVENTTVLPAVSYGMEIAIRGGRKRVINGPVQKVVERRQRRMIKNRESAARSRARKQAYTVELEAELNQLKEENKNLRKQQEDEREKRRKRVLEAMATVVLQAVCPKHRALRRTWTGPW